MKIKQLKEKTAQGLKDFLPKIGVGDIEGLLDTLNDKLSKSQGGEVNKHIVVTNKDSDYSITINPDGSIYIWSKTEKENVFSLKIDKKDINHFVIINDNINRGLCISKIHALYGQNGDLCYDGVFSKFYASRYVLNGSDNTRVLLGDGSTTNRLIKDVTAGAIQSEYNFNFITTGNVNKFVTIKAATSTTAGVMTAADKAKLDDIENTYVSTQNGNIYSSYDTNNGNTTLNVTGNYNEEGSGGKIRLKRTEDGKGKISIVLDGADGSIGAENFKAISNQNGNEVWCTDGNRLNVINLLKNAAIYVDGTTGLAEGGLDNTTVVNAPDSIIFDQSRKRFLARKDLTYYTHWNANIARNIAPPSRYGIETNIGVYPFNNQLYKFSELDGLYTATCFNGGCRMDKLTIK